MRTKEGLCSRKSVHDRPPIQQEPKEDERHEANTILNQSWTEKTAEGIRLETMGYARHSTCSMTDDAFRDESEELMMD